MIQLDFLVITVLIQIQKSRCVTCPSKWIAGPSNKFPGCFRQYMLFNKSLPNSMSSGLSFCQGYDKRAHLIYLPNLDNGTDLIELGQFLYQSFGGNSGPYWLGAYRNESTIRPSSYYWFMPTSSGRITAPFGPNLWSNDEPNGKGEISKKNSSCVQFSSTSAANDELCYMDACIHCHIYNTSALLPVVQKNLVDKNKKPTSGGCPAPWIEIRGFYYYYSFPTLYSSVPEAVKACRTIHPDATLPLDPLGGIKEYMDSVFVSSRLTAPQYLNWDIPINVYRNQLTKGYMFKNQSITFQNWFPVEPDINDSSKQCVTINYVDRLMWRSAPCENTNLFVVCQLICPNGTTGQALPSTAVTSDNVVSSTLVTNISTTSVPLTTSDTYTRFVISTTLNMANESLDTTSVRLVTTTFGSYSSLDTMTNSWSSGSSSVTSPTHQTSHLYNSSAQLTPTLSSESTVSTLKTYRTISSVAYTPLSIFTTRTSEQLATSATYRPSPKPTISNFASEKIVTASVDSLTNLPTNPLHYSSTSTFSTMFGQSTGTSAPSSTRTTPTSPSTTTSLRTGTTFVYSSPSTVTLSISVGSHPVSATSSRNDVTYPSSVFTIPMDSNVQSYTASSTMFITMFPLSTLSILTKISSKVISTTKSMSSNASETVVLLSSATTSIQALSVGTTNGQVLSTTLTNQLTSISNIGSETTVLALNSASTSLQSPNEQITISASQLLSTDSIITTILDQKIYDTTKPDGQSVTDISTQKTVGESTVTIIDNYSETSNKYDVEQTSTKVLVKHKMTSLGQKV